MPTQTQMKLHKIEIASKIFRTICDGLLVLVALLGLAAVICVTFGVGGINFDGHVFVTTGLTLIHRLAIGLLTAAAWGILVKSFYHLRHLFRIFSRGQVFARESVHQLRQFGVAYLLWAAMSFAWRLSLALSVHPTQTVRAYGDSFVIGVFAVVLAWFMDMAVDLREENELTI